MFERINTLVKAANASLMAVHIQDYMLWHALLLVALTLLRVPCLDGRF